MKKNYLLLFFAFLYAFHATYAQQSSIDSLVRLLPKIRKDTSKVDVLNNIAYKYLFIKPDSTLYYAQQAEILAKELADKKRLALAVNYKGGAYRNKGDLVKGLQYYKESQSLAEKIGNKGLVARNIGLIGLLYQGTGNNELAIIYYQKALFFFEQLKNYERIAITLSNMGKAYIELNRYDSAEYFVRKALPLAEKYTHRFQSYIWLNLGEIKFRKKLYDAAQTDLNKAIFFAQKYSDRQDLTAAYRLLAEIYLAEKRFDVADEKVQKAVKIAEESQRKADMYMAYETLGKLLEAKGDFVNSLKYKNLFLIYKDSVQSKISKNALQLYEYEKKQSEIALLTAQQAKKNAKFRKQITQQRLLTYFVLIAFALMLVIAGLILRSRQKIKKIHGNLRLAYQEIQEKQEEIVSQNEELRVQQEEISNLNNHLERVVEERTSSLSKRNVQLSEYAFFNAHKLRSPIATILGLYELLKLDPSVEERELILEKIKVSVVLLDEMVKQSQKLIDEIDDE